MGSVNLIPGYRLWKGSGLDRAKLVKFMYRTYQEVYPDRELGHLAQTVEQYFSHQTPLWWVEGEASESEETKPFRDSTATVGCLWLGNAIDQASGDRHAHIFLVYVTPDHRRRGIGKALVEYAENWARQRGDRQMGLQVFLNNQPALNLYKKLGYHPHSLWMLKSL